MPRRGLTVVEVAVLLVILLFLAGLGAVLLQRLRGQATQVQCTENLRRIGVAIHGNAGDVPAGILGDLPGPPLPAARIADGYATWAVQLAPYLDASNPLKNWDLRKIYYDQEPAVRQGVLPVFFCPARKRSEFLSSEGDQRPKGKHLPGGLGDYACASGDGAADSPWDSAEANGPIILGQVLEKQDDLILRWQSRTDFASLTRGLSNTILVGEKHVPLDGFGKAASGDGSLYNGSFPASSARVGGPGHSLAQGPAEPLNNNFGSYHPGICQFLMADGSVRPLATSIDVDVLARLIRRD